MAIVFIARSKTDQLGMGAYVPLSLGTIGGIPCHTVIAEYVMALDAWNLGADAPLFPCTAPHQTGVRSVVTQPLARRTISSLLPDTLRRAETFFRAYGVHFSIPGDFASHSFRRGGATFLFANNWPAETIKFVGRWKSSVFE